jgi:hypothetical protein
VARDASEVTTTVELLAALSTCRAGDVLLTGQRGGLSSTITWAGGAPVSHALLVVAPGVAVEARDARWDLKEQGKGVRLIRLESLTELSFELVVAVRPQQQPDAPSIRRWAAHVVEQTAPFASVGLTAMAPLLLAAQLEARSHRFGPLAGLVRPFLQRRRRHLAELVADGSHRVICAELVYRGLLAGGVHVDLSVAQFSSSLAELPPAPVPESAGVIPTEAELLARSTASSVLGKASLPKPRHRFAMNALRSGVRQFIRRASRHDHKGDQADLVTPADLLRSGTMLELWRWETKRSFAKAVGSHPAGT